MYECGMLKKVIGNKILFLVILEQCVDPINFSLALGIQKCPLTDKFGPLCRRSPFWILFREFFPIPESLKSHFVDNQLRRLTRHVICVT